LAAWLRDILAAWLLLDVKVPRGPGGSGSRMGLVHQTSHRTARALLAAAGAVALAGPTLAQTPVKFTLDGKIEGPVAPFVVAVDKGCFKAQGLEVTVDPALGTR